MADAKQFLLADEIKQKLAKTQQKKIQSLYKKIAKETANRIKLIPESGTISDVMRKRYLEEYQKELNKKLDEITKEILETTMSSMKDSAQAAVDANNEFMAVAGLEIKGAFSYIPSDVVSVLSTGKVYKGNWKLSQSIWKASSKAKSDISSIIAKGVAEQKPTFDIAKDLEKYLNPTAVKPWDWSKVYPNTNKKVDYNAQRLARTMIQHSYQMSLKTIAKQNPFVEGILWNSSFAHGRTCALCMERDGTVYTPDKLPLDHPNGLCYFTAEIPKTMEEIADRIADWDGSKSDMGLYNYMMEAKSRR